MKRPYRSSKHNRGGSEHQLVSLLRLDFLFLFIAIVIIVLLSSIEAVIVIKEASETSLENSLYANYAINPNFFALLNLWGKTNLTYTLSLLVPFLLFSLAIQIGMSGITRVVQRSITVAMTFIYLFICTQIQRLTAEAVLVYDLSVIPKIGFFRSLKLIEIFITGLLVILPFLSSTSRIASKMRRFSFLVVVSLLYLVADWKLSKSKTDVHPVFESGKSKANFLVYFPYLSMQNMTAALNGSSLETFRNQITKKRELIATSNHFIPQLTSTLTGSLPFEHGIRSDHESRFGFSYAKTQINEIFFKNFETVYTSNIGAISDVPLLFPDNSAGKKCIINLQNQMEVGITKELSMAFAVLPRFITDTLFPIYRCSTHIENVSNLLSIEFDELTELMKKEKSIVSVFWLDIGNAENRGQLAEVFWHEFDEFISSRKIQNYKLQMVGLTDSPTTPGFLIEIDKESKKPTNTESTPIEARLSVTQLNDQSGVVDASQPVYFEAIDFQSKLKPEKTPSQSSNNNLMQTHFSYDRSYVLYSLYRAKRFWIDTMTLNMTPIDNNEFLKGNDLGFALTHGMKTE